MLNNGALDGITVLDLSRMLPGPYCSMILADHGARVIAIEDRRFQADGLFFPTINRNKAHMSLNLKTAEGRKIFLRLAETADVILEGFRPGVTARLGVDFASIQAINPGIVYCSITGFGQNGPLRDRAGHDVNYLSLAGVLDQIGEQDRPPCIPGVQIADIAAGGLNAAIGILLALLARQKTGQGQHIDISMTDGMAAFLPLACFFNDITGRPPQRGNAMLSHRYGCYNVYETADGRFVAIGAVENRFWKVLCAHLGLPEYVPLQYDEDRRREIIACLQGIFKTRTMAQWEAKLGGLDACASPVLTLTEALAASHLTERGMVAGYTAPDGRPGTAPGIAVKLSATPGTLRSDPVAFGASTPDILQEMGYTAAQIEGFAREGVI
jgi:crotonobetainyl-CoA:carnitine CoA-transferase CaiB-like acyl-CoA transferase